MLKFTWPLSYELIFDRWWCHPAPPRTRWSGRTGPARPSHQPDGRAAEAGEAGVGEERLQPVHQRPHLAAQEPAGRQGKRVSVPNYNNRMVQIQMEDIAISRMYEMNGISIMDDTHFGEVKP